jgi:hypothetical protein
VKLRELLSETPVAILKALGNMISGATKAKHYPTGNLDQLKAVHRSANTATKMGTDTARHTELSDLIAQRDIAAHSIASQRNALGTTSIRHNPELAAAENKLLDLQLMINTKADDLLINKDLGPVQSSKSGMARWGQNSDNQGVLSGSSKGSQSKHATPAEHRRRKNINHRNRIEALPPKEREARRLNHNAEQNTRYDTARSNKTSEQLVADKAKYKADYAEWRDHATAAQRAERSTNHAKRAKIRRANRTKEERATENAKNNAIARAKRAERTTEKLAIDRANAKAYIQNKTPAEKAVLRARRNELALARNKAKRANMTDAEIVAQKAEQTAAVRRSRARRKKK